MKILMDNSGDKIEENTPDSFSSMFDLVLRRSIIQLKNDPPKTIYVKTDYLPLFVQTILPTLSSDFVFASGCSDYSPMINFRECYDAIINNKFLVAWYMVNCLERHPKVKAYPGGVCRNTDAEIARIHVLKEEPVEKHSTSKILCCWRDREYNVCGDQFITRKKTHDFIKQYPEIFDWVEANLSTEEFYQRLRKYKFVLCPVGNGVDPCPKAFEAIILKTVPIVIRTINTESVYSELPCVLVDDFSEVLNMDLDETYSKFEPMFNDEETYNKLSCEYWYDKVLESLNTK
jgi:hypothetical protein